MNRRKPYSKGQWQVARERFHIEDFEPPAPDAGALPLGALVADALKGLRLDAHAQVMQIAAAWPELVGPQLAANTKPAQIENKLLTVFVSHPMWLFELRGAPAAEILARLQAKFGPHLIQNVRWAIDPEPPAR
jgi:predicted nucleic acid-binding Zn ribbon protein